MNMRLAKFATPCFILLTTSIDAATPTQNSAVRGVTTTAQTPAPQTPVATVAAVDAAPQVTSPTTSVEPTPVTTAPPPPEPPSEISKPVTFGSAPTYTPPAFSPAPVEKISANDSPVEAGQVLIVWDSTDTTSLMLLQQRYHVQPRQRYTLGNLGLTIVMVALPSQNAANALRTLLKKEQPQWIIDLNTRSMLLQRIPEQSASTATSTPRLYVQHMLGLKSDDTTTATLKPKLPRQRVGVIDTGISPLLIQSNRLNGSTINIRQLLNPADRPADDTHGNQVLQLMVGAPQRDGFMGVAPALDLYWASVMRDMGGKSMTNSLLLSLALDWLVGQQVTLMNMSLGGQGDDILQTVIRRVIAKNINIVAAVGNNPAPNAPPTYPAAYAGVWSVTAIDAMSKLYTNANHAAYTRFAAPGVDVWVPDTSNMLTGTYVSGTSFAAALASGVLAWQPNTFWALPPAEKLARVCANTHLLVQVRDTGCGLIQR